MSRAQLTSTVEQNTGGAVSPYVAGKNKIINGDFGIWQRGTSFSGVGYTADRFDAIWDGSGTRAMSQQTFTAGTAPVAGYEGTYFLRYAQTVGGTGASYSVVRQKIEDVRTFAGQTVTLSFWLKADSNRTIPASALQQDFGSGGSGGVTTVAASTIAATTSWQRFSFTIAVPSISGKTIGSGSNLQAQIFLPINTTFTVDIWGVQVEAGPVATPFTTATGTLSGELAACQRYYISNGQVVTWQGNTTSASSYIQTVTFPVTMRTAPTIAVTNYSASNFSASPSSGTATTGGFLGVNSATATASAAYYQFTYIASAEL